MSVLLNSPLAINLGICESISMRVCVDICLMVFECVHVCVQSQVIVHIYICDIMYISESVYNILTFNIHNFISLIFIIIVC